MLTDKIENYAILGGLGILAYILIRSGSGLSALKGVDALVSGKVGENISNTVIATSVPSLGGSNLTLGMINADPNRLGILADLVTFGLAKQPWYAGTSLNFGATDKAFAKIGLTTIQVENLDKQIGYSSFNNLESRIINNTLTDNDKALLYANGWTGVTP